jgi:hypothetical protein
MQLGVSSINIASSLLLGHLVFLHQLPLVEILVHALLEIAFGFD